MSKFLQQLLNISEPIFSSGLKSLEKMTGNEGLDVRLISDLIDRSHSIMKKLHLDISDTTAEELYFALNSAVNNGSMEEMFVDNDYVLVFLDGHLISFNLIDIIENLHHGLPLGRNIVSHGQRALRGELIERYIKHARTDEETTKITARHMGLLMDEDQCYTRLKHKHEKHKETAKSRRHLE